MDKIRVIQIQWSDVADVAGISQRTLYNWRKDRRRTTVTTDEKIKEALKNLYGVEAADIQDQLGENQPA